MARVFESRFCFNARLVLASGAVIVHHSYKTFTHTHTHTGVNDLLKTADAICSPIVSLIYPGLPLRQLPAEVQLQS